MLRERLERRPAVRGRGERAEAMAKAMDKPRDTKGKVTGGCWVTLGYIMLKS